MTQSLLDLAPRYPRVAGHHASAPATSRLAALSVPAGTYRHLALSALLSEGPMTADEVADFVGESLLTIRPRMTELKRLGLLRDTGARRANASGRQAVVWEAAA